MSSLSDNNMSSPAIPSTSPAENGGASRRKLFWKRGGASQSGDSGNINSRNGASRRTRLVRVGLPLLVLGVATVGVLGPVRVVEAAKKLRSYPGGVLGFAPTPGKWAAGTGITVGGTNPASRTMKAKPGSIVDLGLLDLGNKDLLTADNTLHDDEVTAFWTVVGGVIEGDNRGNSIQVLTPTTPGTVTVTAEVVDELDGEVKDHFDDPPVTVVITIEVEDSTWQAGDPISFSLDAPANGGIVSPGETVTLTATASDSDLITPDNVSQPDTALKVYWNDGATGLSRPWTAPTTPGTYTVSAYASDNGTSQFNDNDPAGDSVTLTVPEPATSWSAAPELPNDDLTASSSEVKPGAYVTLIAPPGQDYDTRTRGGKAEVIASGALHYEWEAGKGRIVSSNGNTAVWQAPETLAGDPDVVNGVLNCGVSCTWDDGLSGTDNGVMAPDTGDRNDQPVAKSASIAVKAAPCGSWKHQSWASSQTVTWTEDESGHESPSITDTAENLKWDNACGGTEPDPNTKSEDVAYTLLSDRNLTDSGGETYREVRYQATSTVGGPASPVVIGTYQIGGRWNPSPGISGGEPSPLTAGLALEANATLPLHVNAAVDMDTYSEAGKSRQLPDEVVYTWSIESGGGSFEGDTGGPSVTYKAPATVTDETPVTVRCLINDVWEDEDTGVMDPEMGNRNDAEPLEASFNFILKPVVSGKWQHKSWQGSTLEWDTDGNGDPEPVQPSMALEMLEWVGTPTKPDKTVGVPYSRVSDEPIKGENNVWKRKAKYTAYSTVGGDSTELEGERALPKHWDVLGEINGGTLTATINGIVPVLDPKQSKAGQVVALVIPLGSSVKLGVAGINDSDSFWYWGVPSESAEDEVTMQWTSQLGNGTPQAVSGGSPDWSTAVPGEYTLVGTVDDAWMSSMMAPELGNRNDTPAVHTVIVKVVPRNWEADPAIGQKPLFNNDGSPKLVGGVQQYQETGRMLAPQDQRAASMAAYLPQVVHVRPGQTIDLRVEAATDFDHWTTTEGEGFGQDGVKYEWSVTPPENVTGTGSLIDSLKPDSKWTAPSGVGVNGTYTLTCTINDIWDGQATGITPPHESGNRNDNLALIRSVQVEVSSQESWAEIKVFTKERGLDGINEAENDEKYNPIEGTVWPMLYLYIGANEEVDPSIESVVVRIENTEDEVAGQTNPIPYWDAPPISFVPDPNKAIWEEFKTEDENGNALPEAQWVSIETPRGVSADVRRFRAKFPCNTLTKPLGLDGWHSLRLSSVKDGDPTLPDELQSRIRFVTSQGIKYESGPEAKFANVKVVSYAPLSEVLENFQGFNFNDIQSIAEWEAELIGPLYISAPDTSTESRVFEGNFIPEDSNTRLAIFSDSGCDVFINGKKIHGKRGQEQELSEISEALSELDFDFVGGETYRIVVDYRNSEYLGGQDMDGVSLFAFSRAQTNAQGVASMDYSLDAGETWKSMPQQGEPSYPLTVNQGTWVDFRAVKNNSEMPWPDGLPTWTGVDFSLQSGYASKEFVDVTSPGTELNIVTAVSGDNVSRHVKVIKQYYLELSCAKRSILAGGGDSTLASSSVEAQVYDFDGNPIQDITVLFDVKNGMGVSSGTIGMNAVTDQNGIAHTTVRSSKRVESMNISARVDLPNGTQLIRTKTIDSEALTASVDIRDWEATPQGQRALCDIKLYFGDSVVSNRAITLKSMVADDPELNVINTTLICPIDKPKLVTDKFGQARTYIRWNYNISYDEKFQIVDVFDDSVEEDVN